MNENPPVIIVSKDGPFIVKNLKTLRNPKGVFIEANSPAILCRCGDSEKKLFCDGTYIDTEFKGRVN